MLLLLFSPDLGAEEMVVLETELLILLFGVGYLFDVFQEAPRLDSVVCGEVNSIVLNGSYGSKLCC